jgi:hypothetical protein
MTEDDGRRRPPLRPDPREHGRRRAPTALRGSATALAALAAAACAPPAMHGAARAEPTADQHEATEAPAQAELLPSAHAEASDGPSAPPASGSLKVAAAAAGLPWPPPDLTVHVDKAARKMRVRSGATDLVAWPVALGGTNADKVRQGDRATPEGAFRVVTRNDRSRFHLFLGLSYPTGADADRGVRDGLITEAQARRIREADRAGRAPPWETALGGAIGLHGGGAGADWTLGCVAIENAQIEELWEAAPLGTVVQIGP